MTSMLSEATIQQLVVRLHTHRQTLAHFLQQRAQLSGAYEPPAVSSGINEARREIERIKTTLRFCQVMVDDQPDDVDAQLLAASLTLRSATLALTTTEDQVSSERGRPHSHCPPEAKFDMEFMPYCVRALSQPSNLTGLAIKCVVPAFVESFCERLRHIKGRDRLDYIADRFTLTDFDTIETVIDYARKIVNLHRAQRRKNLLCAVRLEAVDSETLRQQVEALWHTVTTTTVENAPFKLVIVLFTRSETPLPEGIMQIGTPNFEEGHVAEWVADMVEYFRLTWRDTERDAWAQRIIEGSRSGQTLHVEHVYSYLRRSLRLLASTPLPSPDSFLNDLV